MTSRMAAGFRRYGRARNSAGTSWGSQEETKKNGTPIRVSACATGKDVPSSRLMSSMAAAGGRMAISSSAPAADGQGPATSTPASARMSAQRAPKIGSSSTTKSRTLWICIAHPLQDITADNVIQRMGCRGERRVSRSQDLSRRNRTVLSRAYATACACSIARVRSSRLKGLIRRIAVRGASSVGSLGSESMITMAMPGFFRRASAK